MRSCSAFIALWFASIGLVNAKAEDPPKSLDPRLKVELFAEHPQIVTPTGLDVDHRGRVFAIESNTHFPPEGYKGHPTDRVLVMSDSDNDGKADKIVVFTDGLKFSMSVVVRPLWFPVAGTKEQPAPKQSVYIATRAEIFQFHDDDGDDKADRKESIVRLDTKGNYPHNGLAGFAIDALGWMYFGFGENLGADYKVIGSDGTTLSGGGEGGNIYRCRLDGTQLSQIATGFWNPHANCFDAFGRLFSVDNDPDSRPPCRLLHVIPGGDYGYKFRNGRKGLHPFTSWNGEIPGTLPMVAGTGEAPSGILAYESDGLPEEYLGNLLVTSWGDHRIDRFRLQPKGTSFTSLPEPLITGGENFRPVGIATAPDGSLFCTDWVLRDYKLHGHGRIWRIAPKVPPHVGDNEINLHDQQAVKQLFDEARADSLDRENEILKKCLNSPSRDVRRQSIDFLRRDGTQVAMQRLYAVTNSLSPQLTPRGRVELFWGTWRNRFNRQLVPDDGASAWADWSFMTPVTRMSEPRMEAFEMIGKLTARNHDTIADLDLLLVGLSMPARQKQRPPRWTADDSYKSAITIDDPFLFATLLEIARRGFTEDDFAKALSPASNDSPKLRQAMLLAARKQAPKEDRLLRVALSDHDPDVRRLAVQWVAEEKLTDLKPRVEELFNSLSMTPELFLATLAALEMLDGKKPEDFDRTPAEQYVIPLLKDEKRSPAVRAQALRLVSPTDKSLDAKLLANLLKSDHEPLRLETVRTLQAAKPDLSGELLREVVANDKLDKQLRAEAMVGLATVAKSEPIGGASRKLLRSFLHNREFTPLRREALRAVRPLVGEDMDLRAGVLDIANTPMILFDGPTAAELFDQISLAFSDAKLELPEKVRLSLSEKPKNLTEWMVLLNSGRDADLGDADPAAGRRVFFHTNSAGCFKCHTVQGRGGKIGPDLSTIARSMSREKLIDSILEPSREIAPQFVAWTIETKDGRTISGMIVHENEGKTIIGDAEGKLTEVKTIDIETRTPQKTSVMPEKLVERMTLQEIRDLLAFLESLK